MKVVLTGYNGFLGGAVLQELLAMNFSVNLLGRGKGDNSYDCNNKEDLEKSLKNAEVVIHCAARAHVMEDSSINPWDEYYNSNFVLTQDIVNAAVLCKVKRFIFISSLKVNGEESKTSFNNYDTPNPNDYYSKSKYLAEEYLRKTAETTNLEIVIIRPPLIYGAGVKANFASLVSLVKKNYPLPFGAITKNKRSMVSIYNLVDLIKECMTSANAANQTFLVSDNEDLSTKSLIEKISVALGQKPKLIYIPVVILKSIGWLTNKSSIIERLTGSLTVCTKHTEKTLDWKPPFTVTQSLEKSFSSDTRREK